MPNPDGTYTSDELAALAAAAGPAPAAEPLPWAPPALAPVPAAGFEPPLAPAVGVAAPTVSPGSPAATAPKGHNPGPWTAENTAGFLNNAAALGIPGAVSGDLGAPGGGPAPASGFTPKAEVPGAGLWQPGQASGTPNAQGTGMQLSVPAGVGGLGMFENTRANVGQQQRALGELGDAEAAKARYAAEELQRQVDEKTAQETERQKALAEVQSEGDRLRQDILESKIDPRRLWNSRTDGEKAMSLIGIVLSGIGSGLTGQPNLALQVIDKAIDRDINAQTAELGKKENALSSLMQKYGNLMQAQQALRLYQGEVYKTRLESGLAAMDEGVQKQKARLMVAQAGQTLAQMQDQFAQQIGMMRWQMSMVQGQTGGAQQFGYGSEKNRTPPEEIGVGGILKANAKDAEKKYYLPDGTPMLAVDPERAKVAAKAMGNVGAAQAVLARLAAGGYGPVETSRAIDTARLELARLIGVGQISEQVLKDAENIIGGWKARLAPGVDPYSVAQEVLHDRLQAAVTEASGVKVPVIRKERR